MNNIWIISIYVFTQNIILFLNLTVNSEPVNTCLNISGGIFRVKDKCYTVTISSYATTWMAAHRKCKQDGGDLITIVDSDMQTSLIQMVHLRGLVFSVQHIWIGLTNRKWQWVTGMLIVYSTNIQFLHLMRGLPMHYTRLHARLPPSLLGRDARMTSTERSFGSQATWVFDVLDSFFDMLSMVVCTTRHL